MHRRDGSYRSSRATERNSVDGWPQAPACCSQSRVEERLKPSEPEKAACEEQHGKGSKIGQHPRGGNRGIENRRAVPLCQNVERVEDEHFLRPIRIGRQGIED